MNNDLMRYVSGEAEPSRRDRKTARQAKRVYDRVREAAFKADGETALGAHLMGNAVDIDDHRGHLAGDDPVKTALLARFEQRVITGLERIQDDYQNGWNL